jgi:ABC-type oligopeptide transport system ATPase subunit
MYRGKVVESGPVETIFHAPQDPYTRRLIDSVVRLETKAAIRLARPPAPVDALPLLDVRNLSLTFPSGVKAVDDVSLVVRPGETLGVVGESGSGKTTVSRMVTRLLEADAGSVELAGRDLLRLSAREMRRMRNEIQLIFQDPMASLNPRTFFAIVVSVKSRDNVTFLNLLFGDPLCLYGWWYELFIHTPSNKHYGFDSIDWTCSWFVNNYSFPSASCQNLEKPFCQRPFSGYVLPLLRWRCTLVGIWNPRMGYSCNRGKHDDTHVGVDFALLQAALQKLIFFACIVSSCGPAR